MTYVKLIRPWNDDVIAYKPVDEGELKAGDFVWLPEDTDYLPLIGKVTEVGPGSGAVITHLLPWTKDLTWADVLNAKGAAK